MKNICPICKKKIKSDESFSQGIEEDFKVCHLSCSMKPSRMKKYYEPDKKKTREGKKEKEGIRKETQPGQGSPAENEKRRNASQDKEKK